MILPPVEVFFHGTTCPYTILNIRASCQASGATTAITKKERDEAARLLVSIGDTGKTGPTTLWPHAMTRSGIQIDELRRPDEARAVDEVGRLGRACGVHTVRFDIGIRSPPPVVVSTDSLRAEQGGMPGSGAGRL